jgi:hypothetical protein
MVVVPDAGIARRIWYCVLHDAPRRENSQKNLRDKGGVMVAAIKETGQSENEKCKRLVTGGGSIKNAKLKIKNWLTDANEGPGK